MYKKCECFARHKCEGSIRNRYETAQQHKQDWLTNATEEKC